MRLCVSSIGGSSLLRALCLILPLALAVAVVWLTSTGVSAACPMQETAPKLRWAPPELNNPRTIELGTGYTYTTLDPEKDYIIELPPRKKVGATVIDGGHNIVIIGGHITVPPVPESAWAGARRALYIMNATGKVHVEGVLIDGSGGGQSDGFAYGDTPNAVYQLQNMRIVGLHGNSDFHADVIQGWGGIKQMRIDRLTGSSNYQGLFFGGTVPAIVKNTNLFYKPSSVVAESGWNRYLLWLTQGTTSCEHMAVRLEEVYITPKHEFGQSFWPNAATPPACAAVISNGVATWPKLELIKGKVMQGPPANGSFVPKGAAGPKYVSPGYE